MKLFYFEILREPVPGYLILETCSVKADSFDEACAILRKSRNVRRLEFDYTLVEVE